MNKEEIALTIKWNKKLKESGFEDIEAWDGFEIKKRKQLRFIKSHIRWSRYKSKQNFLYIQGDMFNYFRVLGIYAHHGPIPLKYKEIVIEYAQIGSLPQAIKNLKSIIPRTSVQTYINHNIEKMVKFVNELENE